MAMQPLNKAILSRIYGHGRGWVFTPKHFSDLGDSKTVATLLGKLVRKGTLNRVTQGIYYYPRMHASLGALSPSVDSIVTALKIKEGTSFQPSAAYAANMLGLSAQVPTRIIFFTNGKSRKISIGNRTIELKKTAEKNIHLSGTISGLIIEALKYIGRRHIQDSHIAAISKKMSERDKKHLKANLRFAPIWLRPFLLQIIGSK